MWKITDAEFENGTSGALQMSFERLHSRISVYLDEQGAAFFLRSFKAEHPADLVGKVVDSDLYATDAANWIVLQQQHGETGSVYASPSKAQIFEMIALYLSMGIEPDLSMIDSKSVTEALMPNIQLSGSRNGWFERLAARVVTLSEGNASIHQIDDPKVHGLGGIMGPAIYCELRRMDLPTIYLSIGPYSKPVRFKRPPRAT